MSIYSQKSRRSYLLIEYLSVKKQELLTFLLLLSTFISFSSNIPSHRRLDFWKEQLFLPLNTNRGLKVLIMTQVTKI